MIALLAALTIWGFVDVRRRGYLYPETPSEHKTDLTVYTEAGAVFFDGRPPYEVANPRGWTYLYPPLFALLLAPLHALPTQDQVTVWFFFSLLVGWGCYRECGRLLQLVRDDDDGLTALFAHWFPWLAVAAIVAAMLPTLNCLQRGQVGLVKFYLLLLGFRLLLGGRGYRAWLAGGVVLAAPVVLKIIPLLPVAFVLFLQLVAWAHRRWERLPSAAAHGRRFVVGSLGVAIGLVLFFLVIPAALIGWTANMQHLDTWGRFMLTKADDGGVDPRSGNSRAARNQSLHNAVYRLGNFAAYELAGEPDDRLVEQFDAPKMAMDSAVAERSLLAARMALLAALVLASIRLSLGRRLDMAVGFALACVAMLVASPVARGHYFMLLAPAVLFVPLWLDRQGMRRAAVAMAVMPAALSILHYALLGQAGRIGLLGIGTAAWLMAAMVLVGRAGPLVPLQDAETAGRPSSGLSRAA